MRCSVVKVRSFSFFCLRGASNNARDGEKVEVEAVDDSEENDTRDDQKDVPAFKQLWQRNHGRDAVGAGSDR